MLNESTIRFSAAAVRATKIATVLILFFGLQFGARADISAYMVTVNKDFGTIDLSNGDFTSAGFDQVQLAGLGEIGSTVYGVDYAAGEGILYTVDTANGSLTQQGTPDNLVNYQAFGSTLTTLYALSVSGGNTNLYSIDPNTGEATLVGNTGLTFGGDYTLSTNSNVLYFALGTDLYTLSTTNGAATLVGGTGGPQFGGLVTEGGTLYGGEYSPAFEVDTLNTGSGAATGGPPLSGTSSGFAGLAPVPTMTAVPEPSSFSLLLLVVLSAGILIIKARRQTAADPD